MSPRWPTWLPQWASAASSANMDKPQPNQCLVAYPWLCCVATLNFSKRPRPVTEYGFRCPDEACICHEYRAHRAKAIMAIRACPAGQSDAPRSSQGHRFDSIRKISP